MRLLKVWSYCEAARFTVAPFSRLDLTTRSFTENGIGYVERPQLPRPWGVLWRMGVQVGMLRYGLASSTDPQSVVG